jgi:tetratricopeptide (TPR) repeat protein
MVKTLQAAHGYLELGMVAEANAEIESLPPEEKTRTDVLEMRLEIYRSAKAWVHMEVVAGELLRQMPEHPKSWVDAAIAVRRTDSVQAARELLEQAEAMFPENATIQFNLGCYSCLLGDIEEAKRRVERATELDPQFKLLALDDPDLEAMWKEIGGGNKKPLQP